MLKGFGRFITVMDLAHKSQGRQQQYGSSWYCPAGEPCRGKEYHTSSDLEPEKTRPERGKYCGTSHMWCFEVVIPEASILPINTVTLNYLKR